jgi:hypothetical protein
MQKEVTLTLIHGYDPENKIQAIKQIRTFTGMGLKESKAIADDIWRGVDRIVKVKVPFGAGDLKECFRVLRNTCNINAFTGPTFASEIGSKLKECISLCLEHDEAEMLEVLSVAFKMACEK